MVVPFLPDIIRSCVARMDAAFSLRAEDPFHVFFDKGILPQVRRSVYKADLNFPLVWLVMKYDEDFKGELGIYTEASFQVIIAMPTDPAYTQQQREDISFKPRLIPIAKQFIRELEREKWFFTVGENSIKRKEQLLPYWGMGDVEGTDVPNLFKEKFIDAVSITIKGLKIKRRNCTNDSYSLLDADVYPVGNGKLLFFDDLELIVDGGEATDPVDGATSVIIPELKNTEFEVVQRMYGPLRKRRAIEVEPDNVNGGFALLQDLKFASGDVYFVKRRPVFIP